MISNNMQVKRINVEIVRGILKASEYSTKSIIASATGLSIATCGTILNELVESGEVLILDLEKPNGGRPAARYVYNEDFMHILCLFVQTEGGKNSLTYSVVNLKERVIENKKMPLEKIDYGTIDHFIENILKKFTQIKAIGIGMQGAVHKGVVDVCDIKELVGVHLRDELQEKYNMNVFVENDMNVTVYGYYHQQNYEEDKSVGIVFFPKDNYPGAGIMIDGNVIRGTTGFAGEISYLPFKVSHDELLQYMENPQNVMKLAAKSIVSITAVMNPAKILLTGEYFKEEYLSAIEKQCLEYIPKLHMPEIEFKSSMDQEYMSGLIGMVVETLSYPWQLVQRKI